MRAKVALAWMLPALMLAPPAMVQAAELDGRAIIARAFEAAGGEDWARARTLSLLGRAVFFGAGPAPRIVADDYRMWREFEASRSSAHGEAGKVRIESRSNGRLMFLVGSNGEVSFNEKGVIPKAEADAFWANNFGFGVIRSALGPGFKLERMPDDNVDGHPTYTVKVTDPAGTTTLFGIDKASHFIRLAGFATPSGWHVRTYDDFVAQPGWTQARKVTLYYNGVIANQVFWDKWAINDPMAAALFQPPSEQMARQGSSAAPD
ncbi:MAG: hypothetical protein ACMVO5_10470 [Polymorphobacter sp.]|uniref:hypothetical protein n=1 Tax=Polymorphobacter sp. TaxID=1909290 RepID=UPI003A89B860